MAEVADKLWTLEEFLAFDDGTDTSYQLFEGRIVAMNPPLRGHAVLAARLARIVGNKLKPPCEVAAEAGIIPINRRHSWYKADLIVTCTPGNQRDQFIAEPVLVVEVLSPTTSATDFNRKLPDYQQIQSMLDILLVSSMERLVRHWRRAPNGWIEHGHRRSATVRLSGLPVTLRMSDLYDGILPG
jgi:Uma2 family endonuclease